MPPENIICSKTVNMLSLCIQEREQLTLKTEAMRSKNNSAYPNGQPATPTGRWWAVYIIESVSGKLYTGITTDIARRFEEHASDPKKGARFFRTSGPKKIVHTETGLTRSEAGKREAEIKRMTRRDKLKLVSAQVR